ncbi:MAG: sodium:panthothenate symporter [Phycisphaerae bacterium]|nr:sodium:panthothenate symporter [Phycisphaerae bacterium]
MHWIDWCITLLPLVFIMGMAVYSRRYVRGVADYVAAGRVAGRYVIAVGDLESAVGLMSLVGLVEMKYQTGYALDFWGGIGIIFSLVISLTGYCVYRFRETKAMSLGQFLEIRYSRPLRIYAAFLRAIGDTMGNAIGPTVAATFFIYFLGLPHQVILFGITVPTFLILVAIVLTLAMVVIWMGGRIALLITDCIQGLMSYPIFVIITVYVLWNYSLLNEITPVMMDRVEGESFLNPFDIHKLRDFNLFMLGVGLFSRFLNRANWFGNDNSSCGRTPHEQKMAGVLGAWRGGFYWTMSMLLAVFIITIMAHVKYSPQARDIRVELSNKVAEKVIKDDATRSRLMETITALPEQKHVIGVDPPLSNDKDMDTAYLDAARETLGKDGEGNYVYKQFETFYHQMMIAVTMRRLAPIGIMGVFCLLMIMLMISTDDSRIVNCSAGIIQDIVVPLRKKPLTPKEHLFWLRMCALGVAIFFFLFSMFFVQIDYINMFITIMLGIWTGGAGAVMVFGLYSRFGNTAGAFTSLFLGSSISVGGVALQSAWAKHVYPFLDRMGWTGGLDHFLRTITSPFAPYVDWKMDPVKFPINSYEIYFLAMVFSLIGYVAVSLLTYREPYNLDRMLHRGKYSIDGEKKIHSPWTWRSVWGKLVGITPEYSKWDRVIAWSVFGYSFVFQLLIMFIAVLVWNAISPWPRDWWRHFFFFKVMTMGLIVGIVSTVWFMIGGIRDTRRMFKDLAKRVDNPLDDGRVEGHVSLMDKAAIEADDREEDDEK